MSRRTLDSAPIEVVPQTSTELIENASIREAVSEVLAGVEDVHSAPPVVQKVLEITQRLDFDIRDLCEVVAADPALCAKILRLVNSASYGLPREVTSIRQAITILGQRALRLVVLTFSLVEKLAQGVGQEMYASYWRNALTTGVVASRLARNRRGVLRDEAYSSGLLADLGILVLAQKEPDRYPALYLSTPHDESLLSRERGMFGCHHAEIGASLLDRWGFSRSCSLAALYHHELRPSGDALELVVMASAMTAEMLWSPSPDLIANTRSILRSELDCDTDSLINLVMFCKDEISRQAELFGVDRCEGFDVQSILEQARKLFVAASFETAKDFDTAMDMLED